MVVAPVPQRRGAECSFDVLEFDRAVAGERARHLERREHLAAVATRPIDEQCDCVVVGGRPLGVEPAAHQHLDGRAVEWFQPEQRGTTPQRGIHLEERVLGGGADQGERAVLHGRKQCVLLRLREAMDLVEEQNRSLPPFAETLPGTLDRLADVLHAGIHCRQLLERPVGAARNCERERRLSRAGRTPQQRRGQPVGLDETPQWLVRPDEMILSHDVVDRARPQPSCQRCSRSALLLGGDSEQIVAHGVRTAR